MNPISPLEIFVWGTLILVAALFFIFKPKESKYKKVEEEIYRKEAAKRFLNEFIEEVDNGEMLFM